MPIFFQHEIDVCTRLAVWKITEPESFFLPAVPLQRHITHPQKRLQHLAGRYLLRHLSPNFPLQLIKVADTRKPFLENDPIHFSISHCGNYAAAIVSTQKRVGIDVELFSKKVQRIQTKFASAGELKLLDGCDNVTETCTRHLTMLWSCKEAVFKWWSFGGIDFKQHLQLKAVGGQQSGAATVSFLKNTPVDLLLHFKLFDEFCLAWIAN